MRIGPWRATSAAIVSSWRARIALTSAWDGGRGTPKDGTRRERTHAGRAADGLIVPMRCARMPLMGSPPAMEIDTNTMYRATITTPKGAIVMDLDPRIAPKSVNNFVVLARQGYYDGLTFHRVEPGFVIQGGCPEGSGRGGPGYKFADEPVQGEYIVGAVAMANAGPDTNGSQFFICLSDLS